MNELSRQERMAMSRVDMPEHDAQQRARTFEEVNLGLTAHLATLEAQRCLQCRRPVCVDGCPVGVKINEFIDRVASGDIEGAANVIALDNALPAVCGRVCPQEHQCEGACVLAKKERPIAIGHLERFVADAVRAERMAADVVPPPRSGKRVAVVGSGPAGLACAGDLARNGHDVTVFEALHELGGVLVYGIPEYRLPKDIVAAEIDGLRRLGVDFQTNAPIGMAETIDELLESYDAVFIGVGAGLPRFLDVPGEHLVGVYSANEFLTRVNLMRAYLPGSDTPVYDLHGRTVAVIGGGNTAMDAVRTALRLGAACASIYYRRTEAEMPARLEEVRHAREEGVTFRYLVNPVEFVGNDDGWLTGVRLQSMALGEPDDSGRRRPVVIEGSEEDVPMDVVIVAAGNTPNPMLRRSSPDLRHTRWGTIEVDADTGRTSKRGVFAGGDIVTGGATVILAMGAGRTAAAAIEKYLATDDWM